MISYHTSTLEVASMDDELPLIIFVVSNLAENVRIFSKLNFVKDFIEKKTDMDFEEQILANIELAVNYVANDWKLEPKA